MKKNLFVIVIFFIAAVAFRYSGLEITYLQLIFLPVLLWIFTRTLPKDLQITTSLAITILIFASLGVAVSFNLEAFKLGGVLVARFSDDPLESQSRLFRQKLSAVLKRLPGAEKVHRYPIDVDSESKAERLLSDEHRMGLIWGNSQSLNVSVPAEYNDSLESIIGSSLEKLGIPELSKFYLARYITEFSIPLGEKSPTDLFLGYLLTAIAAEPQAMRSSFTLQTLGVLGPWRWLDHRAYPFWMEGTERLLDAIDSGYLELAELDCASGYLKKASSFLYAPGAHPKLNAAILNNQAIIKYILSMFSENNQSEPTHRMVLERALKLAPSEASEDLKSNLRLVISHNLSILKGQKQKLKNKDKKSVTRRSN